MVSSQRCIFLLILLSVVLRKEGKQLKPRRSLTFTNSIRSGPAIARSSPFATNSFPIQGSDISPGPAYPQLATGYPPQPVETAVPGSYVAHTFPTINNAGNVLQNPGPLVRIEPPMMSPIRVPLTKKYLNVGKKKRNDSHVALAKRRKEIYKRAKNLVSGMYQESITMMGKQLAQYRDEANKYRSRIGNINQRIKAYQQYSKKMNDNLRESRTVTAKALRQANDGIKYLNTQITSYLHSPEANRIRSLRRSRIVGIKNIHKYIKRLNDTNSRLKKENKRDRIEKLRESKSVIATALRKTSDGVRYLDKQIKSYLRTPEAQKIRNLRRHKVASIKDIHKYTKLLNDLDSQLGKENKRDKIPSNADLNSVKGRNIQVLLGKRKVFSQQLGEYNNRMKALNGHIVDYRRSMKTELNFWKKRH